MPIYEFVCEEGHRKEIFRKTPYKRVPKKRGRCSVCGLYMRLNYMANQSKVTMIDRSSEPIHHLLKKRGTKGVLIEHLGPKPVYVTSREQYNQLLRKTRSREKQTGYVG